MSEEIVTLIIELFVWLALPIVYGIMGFIFFFLIVKPFFSYVFDPERVATHNAAEETTSINEASKEFDDLIDSDDLTVAPDEDIPDILTDDQKIAKLAASNPKKGQELVKQWLNSEHKPGPPKSSE